MGPYATNANATHRRVNAPTTPSAAAGASPSSTAVQGRSPPSFDGPPLSAAGPLSSLETSYGYGPAAGGSMTPAVNAGAASLQNSGPIAASAVGPGASLGSKSSGLTPLPADRIKVKAEKASIGGVAKEAHTGRSEDRQSFFFEGCPPEVSGRPFASPLREGRASATTSRSRMQQPGSPRAAVRRTSAERVAAVPERPRNISHVQKAAGSNRLTALAAGGVKQGAAGAATTSPTRGVKFAPTATAIPVTRDPSPEVHRAVPADGTVSPRSGKRMVPIPVTDFLGYKRSSTSPRARVRAAGYSAETPVYLPSSAAGGSRPRQRPGEAGPASHEPSAAPSLAAVAGEASRGAAPLSWKASEGLASPVRRSARSSDPGQYASNGSGASVNASAAATAQPPSMRRGSPLRPAAAQRLRAQPPLPEEIPEAQEPPTLLSAALPVAPLSQQRYQAGGMRIEWSSTAAAAAAAEAEVAAKGFEEQLEPVRRVIPASNSIIEDQSETVRRRSAPIDKCSAAQAGLSAVLVAEAVSSATPRTVDSKPPTVLVATKVSGIRPASSTGSLAPQLPPQVVHAAEAKSLRSSEVEPPNAGPGMAGPTYLCPQCGLRGLPSLAAALEHCTPGRGGSQPVGAGVHSNGVSAPAQQRTASPSPPPPPPMVSSPPAPPPASAPPLAANTAQLLPEAADDEHGGGGRLEPSRIIKLDQESQEEAHRAIAFVLRLDAYPMACFDKQKQQEYCMHLADNLGCDRVDLMRMGDDELVLESHAVGFAHGEHMLEAVDRICNGLSLESAVWGRHQVVEQPWFVTRMHRASTYLQAQKMLHARRSVEAPEAKVFLAQAAPEPPVSVLPPSTATTTPTAGGTAAPGAAAHAQQAEKRPSPVLLLSAIAGQNRAADAARMAGREASPLLRDDSARREAAHSDRGPTASRERLPGSASPPPGCAGTPEKTAAGKARIGLPAAAVPVHRRGPPSHAPAIPTTAPAAAATAGGNGSAGSRAESPAAAANAKSRMASHSPEPGTGASPVAIAGASPMGASLAGASPMGAFGSPTAASPTTAYSRGASPTGASPAGAAGAPGEASPLGASPFFSAMPRAHSPSAGAASPSASAAAASAPPAGEVLNAVAYDTEGNPIIVRQADPSTGKVRTIVTDEEGKTHAFGENTVASLLKHIEDDTEPFLAKLSDRQLRGLVHELGQRLVSNSSRYQQHQEEVKQYSQTANYVYFGLRSDATERDLDNAYRQLAKRMHPDKNGGTEEAKERFQHMKERYESLKQDMKNRAPGEESPTEPQIDKEQEDNAASHRQKEAYDSDDEVPRQEEEEPQRETSISYDPTKRDDLLDTASKMLKKLQNVNKGLDQIIRELQRLRENNR
eukprot:TRINITY_DN45017_c0_g1_i1.p1 TRINITY_DN45017_c0_g1~~TRINITY_DN45017_c0_g1_i1.p1  ORF type:complete len:1363 (+),score=292.19 TRINITY_DN45017_c0_g1_i1:131-4219(+)